MKLTVSGATGSGKSTISKLLAEKLKLKYFSIGRIMRALAQEKGLSIMEFSKNAENNPEIDNELDERQARIGREEDNFVMDSRLGFHFIPDSLKIYLDVDIKEAAKRIMNEKRKEEKYKSLDEAIDFLKKRMSSESKRYKEYYKIDFPKKSSFDLWVDTTNKAPGQVVNEILKRIK
jgi:cytidylate kinase